MRNPLPDIIILVKEPYGNRFGAISNVFLMGLRF